MDQNKGDRQGQQNQNQNQNQNQDQNRPNQNANKEQAEGSRDVIGGQDRNQAGQGGGISNRPLDREQREQEDVPARGQNKSEDRDA